MKGEAGHYSLMQQNIQMGLHEQGRRLNRLIKEIKEKNPKRDMIGLQEVVDIEDQRKKLQKSLPGYHFCFSHMPFKSIVYPRTAYIPFFCIGGLSFFIAAMSTLLYQSSQISLAVFYTLLRYAGGVGVVTLMLYLSLLIHGLSYFIKIGGHMVKNKTCQMGLAIALNKERFQDIQIVESNPFDNPGYVFPPLFSLSPFRCNFSEIICVFCLKICARPGYLLISCWDKKAERTIYVLNGHLVIGLDNINRLNQTKKIHEVVDRLTKGKRTIVFLDGNAPDDTQEIKFLTQHNFVDCWKKKYPSGKPSGHTWENANPLVKSQRMKEQDGRIDYVFLIKNEENVEIKKIEVCGKESIYSDHWGIDAEVIFQ